MFGDSKEFTAPEVSTAVEIALGRRGGDVLQEVSNIASGKVAATSKEDLREERILPSYTPKLLSHGISWLIWGDLLRSLTAQYGLCVRGSQEDGHASTCQKQEKFWHLFDTTFH